MECWSADIFKGKVAFVTGGAGTICSVQTAALVRLGANAAIVGRDPQKTKKRAEELAACRKGAIVIPIYNTDVRDIASMNSAVSHTIEHLGRIDFVIAGAAGNFISPFSNTSANAFKSVIDIDLIGSFNTCKATFEQLRKNKGSILFVTATLQYRGFLLQTHACAAKAGIDAMVRSLAVELGPLGIQVNGIAPGAIDGTEGLSRLLPPEYKDRMTEMIPLGRMGTTTDIANATVFLLSPAGSYVSGHVLVVDGGQWLSDTPGGNDYPQIAVSLNEHGNKL